ncbi:MAG: F0F1 ATP synthase subunit delta [Candidatus Brocadiia bacterium]
MDLNIIIPIAIGFIVIFGSFALLFRNYLASQSNMAIQKLQRINEENLRREVDLKKKLDDSEREYKKKIEEAVKEAKRIIQESEEKALSDKKRVIEDANHEREAIQRDAREEVQSIKRESSVEINNQALIVAAELFKRSIDQDIALLIHNHLIGEAVGDISHHKGRSLSDSDHAEIFSCYPLSHEHKESLQKALSTAAQKDITLTEKKDSNLSITGGAGIYIKIGSTIIDGTFNSLLKKTITKIKEE